MGARRALPARPQPVGPRRARLGGQDPPRVAPVYYQNYLLGEILASQLQAHLLEDVLGGGEDVWARYIASKQVGEHLRGTLFSSGARLDWRGTIARATGRPLDPAPFVAELARAVDA